MPGERGTPAGDGQGSRVRSKGISHSPGALNPPFVFGCVLSPW